MTIDVYTSAGAKKGTATLPPVLFEAPVNTGLMHQALVRQLSGARSAIAHAKARWEVQGSTRKLYAQKGTGRARRGSIRSPLMRGGNKAFGPKRDANFLKAMPKAMRRCALFSCLSLKAKQSALLGLESFEGAKTKEAFALLKKLPVSIGRHILFVTANGNSGLERSTRNIPAVKTIRAAYLNPADVLSARHIIFLVDALKRAEEVFTGKLPKAKKLSEPKVMEEKPKAPRVKKASAKSPVVAKRPRVAKKISPNPNA